MRKEVFALVVMALLISSCNGGSGNDSNAENSKDGKDAMEKNTEPNGGSQEDSENTKRPDKDFKKVYNDRFGFRIEIPRDWEAVSKSANKDGFFIKTGDDNTDIRVYGEERAGMEDISSFECKEESTFKFADGEAGTHCIIENGALYYREKDKQRVTFYIEAPKSWRDAHADKLEHMAKSLTLQKDKPFT